jgi:propanol-preferring alcohol dehydrogenase
VFAMSLSAPGERLNPERRQDPIPGAGEIRLRVCACGVCRTDLHVADGDLPPRRRPIVPGHEIVGVVEALGPGVEGVALGDRLGVPWLGRTCGTCRYCRAGEENLCDRPEFTGWTRDGGYADQVVADARYAFPLPAGYSDAEAAPKP